jgi:hypothetical protein
VGLHGGVWAVTVPAGFLTCHGHRQPCGESAKSLTHSRSPFSFPPTQASIHPFTYISFYPPSHLDINLLSISSSTCAPFCPSIYSLIINPTHYSLTHSLFHLATHPYTCLFITHPPSTFCLLSYQSSQPFIHSCTSHSSFTPSGYSLIHPFIHHTYIIHLSTTHPSAPPIYSHTRICSPLYPTLHPFIHHPSVRSPMCPFIHPATHSLTYSSIHLLFIYLSVYSLLFTHFSLFIDLSFIISEFGDGFQFRVTNICKILCQVLMDIRR